MGGVKGKFSRDGSKKYDVTREERDQQCGVLCVKGGPLQKCAHIKYFVAAGSFYTLAYVMVNLYLVGIITTIEKRFGFSSSSSGMLLSIKELAMVCSTLLMTHLARNVHKPRFLAVMGLCGAVGSALSLLPHFLSVAKSQPSPLHSQITDHAPTGVIATVCVPHVEQTMENVSRTAYSVGQCHQEQGSIFNHVAYSFFAVAAVIIGLSYCSVTALITTYVDDAASSKNNAIYLGIMIAMKPVGPLLAFVLGAIFTSFHESLLDPGYGARDPRWVGAWWLGYILCPSFLVVSSLVMATFPKHLPPELEEESAKQSEVAMEAYAAEKSKELEAACDGAAGDRNTTVYTVKTSTAATVEHTDSLELMEKEVIKMEEPMSVRMQMLNKKKEEMTGSKESLLGGLFQSLGRLIRNPVFVLLSIGLCFTAFIIAGMLPFFPKYLEEYFNQTASMANVLTGFTCAFTAALGVLLGGVFVSHFELNTRSCCLFILATDLACVCCMIGMMLCGCNQPPQGSISNATCDKGCECATDRLQPICGSDGITYMSPCNAGCHNLYKNQTYTDCECIGGVKSPDNGMVSGLLQPGQAVPGVCREWCPLFIPYLILASIAPLTGMMASVPSMTIILRTVKAEDRSLGISFTSALVSLASFVPAPLVFGSLIDASCSKWRESCGDRGACVMYDNDSLRHRYHGASAVFKGIAAILTFLMWLAARRRVVHNQQQQMQKSAAEGQELQRISSSSEAEHLTDSHAQQTPPRQGDTVTPEQVNGQPAGCFKTGAVPPPIDFSPNEREEYPHGSDFLQQFESVI